MFQFFGAMKDLVTNIKEFAESFRQANALFREQLRLPEQQPQQLLLDTSTPAEESEPKKSRGSRHKVNA